MDGRGCCSKRNPAPSSFSRRRRAERRRTYNHPRTRRCRMVPPDVARPAVRHAVLVSVSLCLCGLYLWAAQPSVLAQAPKVAPMHVHHVHLNSVDPAKAAAYYPKPFAATATKTTFNGVEAVNTANG